MRKRITSVLLVLTMMLGLFPNITMALDIAGGSYGTNISWNYDVSSRTLTISGSGKIADHNFMTDDPLPWSEYTDEITHLVIENGITEIGDSVFGGEYSGETLPQLSSVDLPNTLVSIGDFSFAGAAITSITLPESLEEIGAGAFLATHLDSVHIPASVKSLGLDNSSFLFCPIERVTVASDNPYYAAIDNVIYDKDITQIIYYPSENSMTDYRIPDTITETLYIHDFWRINNLESITIPATVTLTADGTSTPDGLPGSGKDFYLYFEGNVPTLTEDWVFFNDREGLYYLVAQKAPTSPAEGLTVSLSTPDTISEGTPVTISWNALPGASRYYLNIINRTANIYWLHDHILYDTTYDAAIPTLPAGEYEISVRAVDENDNILAESAPVTLLVSLGYEIHNENWATFYEEYAEKYITRTSELIEVIDQIRQKTDASIANRIEKLLTESSYRPLIGSIGWPYPNGGRQGSSAYDSGLNTTINWGKTNQGCISYAFFASQYIYGSTGQAIDIHDALELEGVKPTGNEIETFINMYVNPGEHIRFYRNRGGKVHSIVYLTHDSEGIYFLSYPNLTTQVDVLYCSYEKLANALRVDYSDGRGNRTLWLYNIPQDSTKPIDWLNLKGNCPIEMTVSYQGEVLSSIGLDGEQTASFGMISVSGTGDKRSVNLTLDFHHNYEVSILGTGLGTVDFIVEFLDSDRTVVDFRTYLGIPIGNMTQITITDFEPKNETLLLIDNDNDSIIDSGWVARTNEIVANPESDIITQIYGTTDNDHTPEPTPDGEDSPIFPSNPSSSEPSYANVMEVSEGGAVHVSHRTPSEGDMVTITPTPDDGYEVNTVIITDRNGDEVDITSERSGTYTFIQTRGRVTIEVTFTEITPEPLPFTDVPAGYWAYDAIRYVWENGLMNGTSGSAFSPERTITRGQIVAILWRLEGGPVVNYLMDFSDVDPAAYYGEAIRWATSEGIITGYDEATFGPNDAITREQLAAILYRYAQYKGYDTAQGGMAIQEYADYDQISGYALEAMDWAVSAGLINGTSGSTLSPQGSATRAQAAVILTRFCENIA